MAAWILVLMLALEPASKHRATFEHTADAIAKVAAESPEWKREAQGVARTAATIVSIAWFEGRFVEGRPEGSNDHNTSVCMMQVSESNFDWLGVTRSQMLGDVETCLRAGLRMVHASLLNCKARPLEERLGWYAAGHSGCENGLKESRHRMQKAEWLFKRFPPPIELASIY